MTLLWRALGILSVAQRLSGAADFWNRKPPSEWSAQEVSQLLSHSPWAKDVNADFMSDPRAGTPRVGRGGTIEAPPQMEVGREPQDRSTGAKRREPVTVRWESARPVREAGGIKLSEDFKDRYVISVSGLPIGIMEKHGNPAEGGQRMLEQLSSAATLQAAGQSPAQPGVVQPASRAPGTYLFGFSKELLPLDGDTREILFILQTALIEIKARFDGKAMRYRGSPAY